MSYLDRLRERSAQRVFEGSGVLSKLTESGTSLKMALTKPTEPSFVSTAGTRPPLKNQKPEATTPSAQEAARQEVIARLNANPLVQRAFTTRWENDTLIVMLGIRGVGTGELMIPAERIGRDVAAYGVLLECLDGMRS